MVDKRWYRLSYENPLNALPSEREKTMTAVNIIAPEDLPFIEAVSELTFCNPFLQERIDLEKKALGKGYVEKGKPWNFHPSGYAADPNVHNLVVKVDAMAKKCRRRFKPGISPSGRNLRLYQNLVLLHTYYSYREDYDQVIRQAHEVGGANQRIRFFDRFQRELDYFFEPCGNLEESEISIRHFFAFGYQVRRAFFHIFYFIIGTSEAARKLRARVWQSIFTHKMDRYGRALFNRLGDIITLITGPSGSGKELVARAIGLSRFIPFNETQMQFEEDFINAFFPLNLSALSPTLIESELFGHRKGAFTGALQDRKGYFEGCGPCGTVFLDEIGETDASIQVKLLRVLQTRQFQRLGDPHPLPFKGKIMSATNLNLIAEMKAKRFREDFYYRLCADRIETPSLKEILHGEKEELQFLVNYISTRVAGKEEGKNLTGEVCAYIEKNLGFDYSWPGNFRELEQCVRNILIQGDYHPGGVAEGKGDNRISSLLEAGDLTAEEVLRHYITRIYAKTRNYEETARRVQWDRRTVKRYIDLELLKKYSE